MRHTEADVPQDTAGQTRAGDHRGRQEPGPAPVDLQRRTPHPPGRSWPPHPRVMVWLQRTIGNRAVGSALDTGGPRSVQRQAFPHGTHPELLKRLDALVDRVAGEVGAFAVYKKAPLDGAGLPGAKLTSAVSRFQDNDPLQPWMRGYARARLGPANLRLLQEMISMNGRGFPDFDVLFDVPYQDPGHDYGCTLKAAKTLKERAITKIVPIVTITYRNALGWQWTRDYTLAAVEITAGVSASKEKGKRPKVKGGLGGGLLELDISGTAKADPVPIRFWGGNDFSGGVKVLKTAAKARVGPGGGKLPGLTAIVFTGGPFGEISFPFISGLSGSIKGGGKGVSAEVGIGMGVGGAIGLGETDVVPPPELREESRPTRAFYTLNVNIGPFATGSAVPPEMAAGALRQLRTTFDTWRERILEPQAKDLRAAGIDPDDNYRFTLYLTGTTSRSWRTARTEKGRLESNAALGLDRARAVEPEVKAAFSGRLRGVQAESGGTSTLGPSSAEQRPEAMSDEEAERIYAAERAEALKEPDPEIRRLRLKAIDANFGRQSDQPFGRRVHVLARWEGYLIVKALVPVVPAP